MKGLHLGLAGPPEDGIASFRSAYSMWRLIDLMGADFGIKSFEKAELDYGIPGRKPSPYFFRDPVEMAAYLLKQAAFTP